MIYQTIKTLGPHKKPSQSFRMACAEACSNHQMEWNKKKPLVNNQRQLHSCL